LKFLLLARRSTAAETRAAYAHGRKQGLKFEAVSLGKTVLGVGQRGRKSPLPASKIRDSLPPRFAVIMGFKSIK